MYLHCGECWKGERGETVSNLLIYGEWFQYFNLKIKNLKVCKKSKFDLI